MDILWKAVIAAAAERALGYPAGVQRAIGHPVQWMGAVVSGLDAKLNTAPHVMMEGRLRGAAALLLLICVTAFPAWLIAQFLSALPGGGVAEALFATAFIAQKSLADHVRDVERGLSSSLAAGRTAAAKIVGRDTENLDESSTARAALESLAENTADGVVAPLFWYLLLGLPGLVAYKAVNTADSMIGHKTNEHLHFGYAAARSDDLLNFVPARLAALLFAGAALFASGNSARNSLITARRDAGKHRSPNAGWPEAAMAGALGLSFGGPRNYEGERLDLPWLGDGRKTLTRQDIGEGLRLYERSLLLMLAVLLVAAVVL
jgi:adenosylcobinamide-phosphate synthase